MADSIAPLLERRARTVRRASYATGAVLLVCALLAVAYVGSRHLSLRPKRIAPLEGERGRHLFDPNVAFELAIESLDPDPGPRVRDDLRRRFAQLRPALASHAEIVYLPGRESGVWAFHVGMRSPYPGVKSSLVRLLGAMRSLQPVHTAGTPAPKPQGTPAAAYYLLTDNGLFLLAHPEQRPPELEVLPRGFDGALEKLRGRWVFATESDVPAHLAAELPRPGETGPLALVWFAGQDAPLAPAATLVRGFGDPWSVLRQEPSGPAIEGIRPLANAPESATHGS